MPPFPARQDGVVLKRAKIRFLPIFYRFESTSLDRPEDPRAHNILHCCTLEPIRRPGSLNAGQNMVRFRQSYCT